MRIRIAGVIKESTTDGIGVRCTIFTQGCSHNCVNCHNPGTHDFNGGYELDNEMMLRYLKSNSMLKGVTFSGGDPLYQPSACMELAKRIKEETDLDIWCYTGFSYEDIIKNEKMLEFIKYVDVLVDGEYIESRRNLSLAFRGSDNQRIIDVRKTLESSEIVILDI